MFRRSTRVLRWLHGVPVALVLALVTVPMAAQADWPAKPGADMKDPKNWPNDPGYGGEWNMWSFVPDDIAKFPGFRPAEVAMGTGMHSDEAWTRTTGDRRVIIAVLDSGIKWDSDDLVNKFYLNKGELPVPQDACHGPNFKASDPYDSNGDGIFNMADWAKEGPKDVPHTACDSRVSDKNGNGMLDPGDLIQVFSDGTDADGNGYKDDISGWDVFRNDNDPYDDTRYGHGSGEARDSSAEGNNGRGDIGVCPECTVLMVRCADSFLADGNDFASGAVFAVDSGASVIQEALGAMSRSHYADQAIDYAYNNNVVIIASAADELSFHHNMPGTTDHTVYVHAIVYDGGSTKSSTTFLNFNNCTNFGGQLLLSSPGTGCSSEATGVTSGHAGMIYSAALKAQLDPPISAEELRGVLIESADDINVPESATDTTKFPSGPGWDLHFGYGRNNVVKSVDMVLAKQIPPETDILTPSWFEPIEVTRTPKVKITGRIGQRTDGKATRYKSYDYVLEFQKGIDPKGAWTTIKAGTTPGLTGDIAEWDAAEAAKAIDFTAPLVDHDQFSFTLRLRVTAKTDGGVEVKNEHRKSVGLYKDPDLLPGFPIHSKASIEASPKLFDLDGDGKDELIQPTSDGLVHAYKADGTEIAGWPVASPIRPELDPVTGTAKNSCAYRTDKTGCKAQKGTLDAKQYREMGLGTPAIGDLDGDKKVEVVFASYDGHVMAYHADGTVVAGFPVEVDRKRGKTTDPEHLFDDGIFSAVALADLDKDGKLELVVTAMDQQLYVWRFDGKPQPGFPVVVHDPDHGDTHGDRIITSPAIGDIDGDGWLDIATGTNEVFGASVAKNEARGYVIQHDGMLHAGGPYLPGFPVITYGLEAYVLPTVGSGVPGNAALADLDFDGRQEVNFDTIGSSGTFFTYQPDPTDATKLKLSTFCIGKKHGKCSSTFNNQKFGAKSNSTDSPAYILISNGSLGKIDPSGGIDFVKATAGFKFALTFASGGTRAEFDHHLSAWDTQTANMLEGFPRVMDDWQFFSNPAIVDLNNDNNPEVIAGSAGYLLHAWNWQGVEAPGFPRYTMGWILASAAVGDIDGDGKFDTAVGTRDGWLFAWKTQGKKAGASYEWPMHGHDFHNWNNYNAPIDPYHGGTIPPAPDAGPTDSGAADTAPVGDKDASPADVVTTKPATKADTSSCTAGRSGSPAGVWLGGLLLLGIVFVRRRLRA
jgi:hypothetical protein